MLSLVSLPTPRALTAAALMFLALGCASKLDRAAKERIFSPEEPAPDIQRAAETVAVDKAATDGAVWDRLWRMDRLEVTHRIGAHKATATIRFKWTAGDRTVELTENQSFETNDKGEFTASVDNDQDVGFDFVWVGGKAYAKSRYGAFHERRTDQAIEDTVRNQATSALSTVYDLCQRQLHGRADGESRHAGRSATALTLSLGEPWGPSKVSPESAPSYGQTRDNPHDPLHPGPDPDTALRLVFDEKEEPLKISGEVLVDASGVIVKARVRARLHVADGAGKSGAILDLEMQYDLQPSSVRIEAPQDVVSVKLPHVVNDPLWFTRSSAASATSEEDERDSRVEESRGEDEAPVPTPKQKTTTTPQKPH